MLAIVALLIVVGSEAPRIRDLGERWLMGICTRAGWYDLTLAIAQRRVNRKWGKG